MPLARELPGTAAGHDVHLRVAAAKLIIRSAEVITYRGHVVSHANTRVWTTGTGRYTSAAET